MQCNTAPQPLLPGLQDARAQVHFPVITAHKPIGGYMKHTVSQLCLLWWLYWSKQITPLDLRVWFGCQELWARRCQLAPGQIPDFTMGELRQVLRLRRGLPYLRASLRRLQAMRLMTWSPTRLEFATSPTDLQGPIDLSGYHLMIKRIENNQRCVPFPRQVGRLIAQGCGSMRLATLLGHLFRCLYYRGERCVSGGRCKASWIATVFGVDRHQIKRERRHLLAIGLLQRKPEPPDRQWLLNLHGPVTYVNMTWTQAGLREASTRCSDVQEQPATPLPPPPSETPTPLPPPCLDQEPLQELGKEEQEHIHQKPAQADPTPTAVSPSPDAPPSSLSVAGIHHDVEDNKAPGTLPPPSPPGGGVRSGEGKAQPPLAARHFSREMLEDTAQVVAVFQDAVKEWLCTDSQPNRLRVMTLAVHALREGADPGALFAENLRHQRWHGSDADEDAARALLNVYDHGIDPQQRKPSPSPASTLPELSKYAWIVREQQRMCTRAGLPVDVCALVRQACPALSGEEQDSIVRELAQYQRAAQQAMALHRLGELGTGEDGLASLSPVAVECAECGEEGPACTCREDGEDG